MNALQEVPVAPVTSISSSAMLVELSISTWTGEKRDRKAQAKLEDDNNAKRNTTRVTKKLLGEHPLLDKIKKHAAYVRTNVLYAMTMPWSDTGPRLLTTAMYFDFHKKMTGEQQEHEAMVSEFLREYEYDYAAMQERAEALGDLFNPDDYPSVSTLANKFAFRLNYMPVPETGDFRLDINNEAVADLTAHYTSFYERKLVEATNNIWERVYKSLSRMAERLADPEPGFQGAVTKEGVKKFSNTLVEDTRDIVELLKTCNVANDPTMDRMYKELRNTLNSITTEAVKDDRETRIDTKRKIDAAIAALPSLDW